MDMREKSRRGFTLMEIIVVLIIVGVLAAIAVPNFQDFFKTGYANEAQNNLLSIYAAQVNYFNTNGAYCANVSCGSPGTFNCTTSVGLANCLNPMVLNMDHSTYSCTWISPTLTCDAAITSGTAFTMRLAMDTSNSSTPINLTGSFSTSGRNPICISGTACPN